MAKTKHNTIIQGLHGRLGPQLVVKYDKFGRTIVGLKPHFDEHRSFSPAQKNHQLAFREATAYAVSAQNNDVYVQKAAGTPLTRYNIALSDWFHPPEILDVDLDAWTGQPGQIIRIKARDDVLVKQVALLITDGAGLLLEQGLAVQVDPLCWQYTTTLPANTAHPVVIAFAQDLPGHIARLEKTKVRE